ncbi:MAG: type II toxin-antitoxin system RelE/ParE family toxin [Planctomycetes bacterium]|nr:type II toxin-antitoxin system RelE/ParE family toxin [Planctomycetota bacterium]
MNVYFSKDAEEDLNSIFDYIDEHDGSARALSIVDKLQARCQKLSDYPKKGHVPPELRRIHIDDILEITVSPYRIIYEILNEEVNILAVLDGRRDSTDMLHQRLFRI